MENDRAREAAALASGGIPLPRREVSEEERSRPADPGHRPALGFRYRAAFLGEPAGDTELKEAALATAEEALRIACRDLRAGYRPIGIWAPDRSLLYSAAAIRDHCKTAPPA